PRRLASRLSTPLPVMDVQSTETFDPVPGGTRMRWLWEVEPRGVFRPMPALLARMLGRRLDTVLANIKRLLEAQQTTRPCAHGIILIYDHASASYVRLRLHTRQLRSVVKRVQALYGSIRRAAARCTGQA